MDKDDREMSRIIEGDIDTFRQIFNREVPMLRAFAEKFVDRSTSQDIIQDVFLKIWINRETSPIYGSVRAYLFQAVRNRCLNYLERQKFIIPEDNKPLIDEQIREFSFFESPEQLYLKKELLDSVFKAIERLPERSREVFKLVYFENKKAAEIAEMLQISVRTVETQIYKSLKFLRAELCKKNDSFTNLRLLSFFVEICLLLIANNLINSR